MTKKELITLGLISTSITTFSQATDYSKIVFSSKIYEYKKSQPRTKELGINKKLLANIIDLLGDTLYSEKEKKEIISKAWLALTNPKTFDYVYKDFAVRTSSDWRHKNAKGELVLEPNPYLTEWTFNDDEFTYFKLALGKILNYYNLITFGDDAETVKSSFNELLITQHINFQDPKDDDWAFSYLETVNIELEKKGLVAMVTKGHYDIIVCKLDKKDQLYELFKSIQWEFIKP